jgi:hypothetical protein
MTPASLQKPPVMNCNPLLSTSVAGMSAVLVGLLARTEERENGKALKTTSWTSDIPTHAGSHTATCHLIRDLNMNKKSGYLNRVFASAESLSAGVAAIVKSVTDKAAAFAEEPTTSKIRQAFVSDPSAPFLIIPKPPISTPRYFDHGREE